MRKLLTMLACCVTLAGCGGKTAETTNTTAQTPEQAISTEAEEKTTTVTEETKKSDEEKLDNFPTSEQLLLALKTKNENLISIEVFDENTDPNGSLGRPGKYITKADFSDSRVEQIGEYLCGGTIETFDNKDDCHGRAEYLNSLNTPEMGVFGVNQYIYEYDFVLFRVTFDLTPTQAEEYHQQMTDIIEQWEKNGVIDIDTSETELIENQQKEYTVDEFSEIYWAIMDYDNKEFNKLTEEEKWGNAQTDDEKTKFANPTHAKFQKEKMKEYKIEYNERIRIRGKFERSIDNTCILKPLENNYDILEIMIRMEDSIEELEKGNVVVIEAEFSEEYAGFAVIMGKGKIISK